VPIIQLRTRVTEPKLKEMFGKTPKRDDFDFVLTGGGTVYKPNGERLCTVIKGGLSEAMVEDVWPFYSGLKRHTTTNRGLYAGEHLEQEQVKRDGTASKTRPSAPVASVVVGALDRTPRIPFCRQAAPVQEDPEGWKRAQALCREVATLYEENAPDQHERQMVQVRKTSPEFIIAGTPYSSITVNNTFAGAYHVDKGDYGYGSMAVLRRGHYRGCELVMPAYRMAVDLEHRDVIFFDVHETHGNIPFEERQDDAERISIVLYVREKMAQCGSSAEELTRAKNRGALA
jgi:Oxygenase domain of the 2OGFeDO superfamily